MAISDVPYIAYFNLEFIRQIKVDADYVIWMIRHSAEKLEPWMWDANEDVVARDAVDTEGLDCLGTPFGFLGKDIFCVEATPYPKGYLRLAIRGRRETICHHQGPETITVHSEIINRLPKKSAKDMGMMKVAFEDHPMAHDDRK